MSCTNPVRAWRAPAFMGPLPPSVDLETGEVIASSRGLSFQPRDGWESLNVGCGRCDGCRGDRAS